VKLAGDREALIVDIAGSLSAEGATMGGRPPFADMGRPGAAPSKKFEPPQAPATAKFVAGKAPKHWKGDDKFGMAAVTYMIDDDGQVAKLTVTQLNERGNELLPNINRWRGQVGLPELTPKQLVEQVAAIDVGGKPAKYVELLPDKDAAKQQAILGVVLYDAGAAWFFKLHGDVKLVEQERDAFRKFVESSKID